MSDSIKVTVALLGWLAAVASAGYLIKVIMRWK